MTKIFKAFRVIFLVSLLCVPLIGCQSELAVQIVSPHDGATVYNTPIEIKGIVSDPLAEVTVNNTPVVVAENGLFVTGVDLAKGENTIIVVAILEEQEAGKSITIIYQPAK